MSKDVKERLAANFPGLRPKLEQVATCPGPGDIVLCEGPADGRRRAKREPSAYNRFIGDCLRNKHLTHFDPQAMKDCAAKWKQQKGKQ